MSPWVPVIPLISLSTPAFQDRPGLTGEVMSPQWSYLILSTNIPHVELDILVGHRFNVEAHCRNGRDILVELQFV